MGTLNLSNEDDPPLSGTPKHAAKKQSVAVASPNAPAKVVTVSEKQRTPTEDTTPSSSAETTKDLKRQNLVLHTRIGSNY